MIIKQFAILIDSCFVYVSLHVACIPMVIAFVSFVCIKSA